MRGGTTATVPTLACRCQERYDTDTHPMSIGHRMSVGWSIESYRTTIESYRTTRIILLDTTIAPLVNVGHKSRRNYYRYGPYTVSYLNPILIQCPLGIR
jgi:hypothetical protein